MTVIHSLYSEAGSVTIDDASCTRCGVRRHFSSVSSFGCQLGPR